MFTEIPCSHGVKLVGKSKEPRGGIIKFSPTQLNDLIDTILSTATSSTDRMQTPDCDASYLLFMAMRFADMTNNDDLLKVRISGKFDQSPLK